LKPFAPSETGAFDVNTLIREVSAAARPMLEEAGVQLALQPGSGLPRVRISKLLSEAFLELITNAVKAMSMGGVLSIETRLSGGMIEAEFTDTGCGIPPDEQDQAFVLFSKRVGQRPKPGYQEKGIGFGLWWVKTFLQQWGADVVLACSEVGKGSTFVVKLPVEV
jgi:signal transduction histidine kinase